MNVLYYVNSKTQKTVEKSGVGRALLHQLKAAELNGINFASDFDDADVVHINTVFPNSVCAAYKAKFKGIPLVYHAHSTREDFRNSYIGSNLVADLFKEWIKFCYSLGDVIITPTEYSKKLLKGYGIKKPIFAVSNGIDINDYKPTAEKAKNFREKYGISEDEKVVISAGLLIKRKGITDFAKLAARMPEYKFIWFGSANLKYVGKEVRKAIKQKAPNLIFAGYVSKPELQEALSGADLFLFPSLEETEGIVVLEALAMKIPVLVRNIPVYDGWLENKKSAYMANNLDEFEALTRGILEKKLPDLTENGYDVIFQKSLEKTGQQLIEVYREAIRLCSLRKEKQREFKKACCKTAEKCNKKPNEQTKARIL